MSAKSFLTCNGCGSPVPDDAARCPFCDRAVDHQMLGGVGIEARAHGVALAKGGHVVLGRARGEVRTCAHCGASVVLDAGVHCPHCRTKIVIEALSVPKLSLEGGGTLTIENGGAVHVGGGTRQTAKPKRGATLTLAGVAPIDEKLLAAIEQNQMPRAEKRLHAGWVLAGHDARGRTCIEIAIDLGQPGLLEWMLARGCDVDEPDRKGDTALIRAVRKGDDAAVALLLQHGADWSVCDASGRSALDLAERGTSARTIALLREARRVARGSPAV